MALEAKPLFHPEVIRQQVRSFTLPERVADWQPTLRRWAGLVTSGRLDDFNETALLPDFLTDIFCGLLGYTGPAESAENYTFSRERHVEVDGKIADAVLGKFRQESETFVAVLEGKGARDPLDRPFAGRRTSSVDQAYRYAINLPCDWIVVTSMRETRLYHKGSDQHTYERFETETLAHDDALLGKFVFLLAAERVVPASGHCHFQDLLLASEKVGRELTKEFYVSYADMREDAFERLCQANPASSPHELLSCTQKLLDRILFCAFCEHRGLLPPQTIQKSYEHTDLYNPRPVCDNVRFVRKLRMSPNLRICPRIPGVHALTGPILSITGGRVRAPENCPLFPDLFLPVPCSFLFLFPVPLFSVLSLSLPPAHLHGPVLIRYSSPANRFQRLL